MILIFCWGIAEHIESAIFSGTSAQGRSIFAFKMSIQW
jgi:hypothetical protein